MVGGEKGKDGGFQKACYIRLFPAAVKLITGCKENLELLAEGKCTYIHRKGREGKEKKAKEERKRKEKKRVGSRGEGRGWKEKGREGKS